MAISRSFGGQTLLKPGAYSVSRVDNAQGIAVGENNTLMLIGEASDGNPGSEENSAIFTNIQNLVDYYGSGDIVDASFSRRTTINYSYYTCINKMSNAISIKKFKC